MPGQVASGSCVALPSGPSPEIIMALSLDLLLAPSRNFQGLKLQRLGHASSDLGARGGGVRACTALVGNVAREVDATLFQGQNDGTPDVRLEPRIELLVEVTPDAEAGGVVLGELRQQCPSRHPGDPAYYEGFSELLPILELDDDVRVLGIQKAQPLNGRGFDVEPALAPFVSDVVRPVSQ